MFADVHSHILCEIDDGARDIEETKELLVQLRKNGVTHLALTPHYYPHKRSVRSFSEKRDGLFQSVKVLPEAKHFVFSLGAEVYLGETLFNNENLDPLCYRGTRYMLTELEYSPYFTDATKYRLLHLIEDYNVIPVLAHIDRYSFLWKDMELLAELKRMGCCFQVNFSALRGFFSRRQAMKLYKNGFLDFIGEDVHHSVVSSAERKKYLTQTEKSCPGFAGSVSREAVSRLFVSR